MDRGSVADWLEEIGLEAYHDLLAILGISGDLGVICMLSEDEMVGSG